MAANYKVGVIGYTGRGDYGHNLDTAWLEVPETEVVAVADPDEQGRAKAADRLGVEQSYADYEKMLDEAKPDIVAICQRYLDLHAEMAIAAAERGIHVYMEKPICRTLAEADSIIDVCERTHTKLAVAHPTRYSPKIEAIKKIIASNRIGKVLEYRGRGKEDRRGGGEDMWVLGSHVMDMIRIFGGHPLWCFGNVWQDGEPVTAADVHQGNEGIGPLAGDAVRAMYGMPDGTTAYFNSYNDVAANPTRYGLRIYGSHGIIELLEGTMPSVKIIRDRSWASGRNGAQWQDISTAGINALEPLTGERYTSRHQLAIYDLLDAIENHREPKCGMYEARGAIEMIVAVFESHRQGCAVSLPLATRENPLTLMNQES